MRAGDQADEGLPDELMLSDDEASDLRFDARGHLGEALG